MLVLGDLMLYMSFQNGLIIIIFEFQHRAILLRMFGVMPFYISHFFMDKTTYKFLCDTLQFSSFCVKQLNHLASDWLRLFSRHFSNVASDLKLLH